MPVPEDPAPFITHLGLTPLPGEGGQYAESWRGEEGSSIYYLLRAPEFSAPHRLDRVEVFVHHAGAPARMLLLHPGGEVTRPVLGGDVAAGERPQVVVPAGVWQATVTLGAWSLLGTVVVPPYTGDCVEFTEPAALAARFPAAAAELAALPQR
ncbi:cupin domain-containing protein [Amycolatopsis jiangsuensis]|uniref:Putative cupin superfamily sugar epimerase n=1 Tax=Amycolatopsis jiangsuensis TaxID=1181879 RepID=A0A840IPU6_9PSEU|nr:cupin domain-containing protein [Amycolatopsis jiangsuensis]MBB4683198.1 putative cupin superfamily sugar epimerase [Amycolatopsis jiangsuensis]